MTNPHNIGQKGSTGEVQEGIPVADHVAQLPCENESSEKEEKSETNDKE